MNLTQVVSFAQGLHSLNTFGYLPDFVGASKNWALEGQNMMYGDDELKGPLDKASFPAIIDTGSSTISIPGKIFDSLREAWTKSGVKVDCHSNDDFCQVNGQTCDEVAKKFKPIGFNLGGTVFELSPPNYLF